MISREDLKKMQDFVGKMPAKAEAPMKAAKMTVRGNKNQQPPKGKAK